MQALSLADDLMPDAALLFVARAKWEMSTHLLRLAELYALHDSCNEVREFATYCDVSFGSEDTAG
ncbi:MAG: hypothetical protein ACR2Q4_14550 [Geminicoccaceae bacterium]